MKEFNDAESRLLIVLQTLTNKFLIFNKQTRENMAAIHRKERIEIDISPDRKIPFCYIWKVIGETRFKRIFLTKVAKRHLIEQLTFIDVQALQPGSTILYLTEDRLSKLLQLEKMKN